MRVKNAALAIAGAVCDGPSARVLFEYNAGSSVSGLGGTFARADASTCARYRDSNGIWQVVAANVLRDQHYPKPGVGPTTLLEPARTNSALGSCSWSDSTYWTNASALTIATATSCIAGQTAYKHTNPSVAGPSREKILGTFVNGQTDCWWAIVENVDAATNILLIFDNTAAATLVRADLTWATKSSAIVAGSGTTGVMDLGTGPNGGAMVLFWVCGTGTAAGTGANGNTRNLRWYPMGTAANTQSCIIHHAQFEAAASFPSSPIVTVGSAVTRAADALSFPFKPIPQALTLYVKSVTQMPTGAVQGIFDLGGASPRIRAYQQSNGIQFVHNEVGTVNTTWLQTYTIGDIVETAYKLYSDGAVEVEGSLNGAASTSSVKSAALALSAAFGATTLYLNSTGGYDGANAFQSVKIAAGVQSLNTMPTL